MIGKELLQLDTEISNWCVMARYRSIFHTSCYNRLQREEIENMLDISFEQRNREIKQRLTQDFMYKHVFDEVLRYCPICISKGFHSYVHQLFFVKYCYIHPKQEIKYTCPICKNYISLNTLLTEYLLSNVLVDIISYFTMTLRSYWNFGIPSPNRLIFQNFIKNYFTVSHPLVLIYHQYFYLSCILTTRINYLVLFRNRVSKLIHLR